MTDLGMFAIIWSIATLAFSIAAFVAADAAKMTAERIEHDYEMLLRDLTKRDDAR